MLWSSLQAQTLLSCRDSLRLASHYGKILSKGIKDRDSLLSIRLHTISLLQQYNQRLALDKDSLLIVIENKKQDIENQKKLITELSSSFKKEKKRKYISYSIIFLIVTIFILR